MRPNEEQNAAFGGSGVLMLAVICCICCIAAPFIICEYSSFEIY